MTPKKFYSKLTNEIYPFYDSNGRMCKILFASDDEANLLIRQKLQNSNIK